MHRNSNDIRPKPRLAVAHLPLLRTLPSAFAPLLLQQIEEYDWRFPAERREITGQLAYLESLYAGAASRGAGRVCAAPPSRALDWTPGGERPRRIRRAAFQLSLGNTSDGRIP